MARNKDLNIMTSEDETICAWHTDEGRRDPTASHRICDDCADEQRLQRQIGRFERVPSYVERFRNDSRER